MTNQVENTASRPERHLMIVSPTAGLYGGTERVLEILISQVDSESRISFAFLADGPLVEKAVDRGLACRLIARNHFSNPIDTIRVARELRRWIRECDCQIALAWTDLAQLYAAPASWGLCKSVWWQRTNVDRNMISRLCRFFPSSGAIANSKFTRDQLRASGVRVADEPLYPPFEASKFAVSTDRNQLRKELGLPLDRTIIGSVGRMQSWKGFNTFVDSIASVRRIYPEVFGVIVGGRHDMEPDYEPKLRRRISELGLDDHFMLSGSRRNVAQWMGAMDIFVHAAEREPFGIVVPEAMALGLPVIASIPGGPSESIEHEKSGLLVQSGNVEDLVFALQHLIEEPSFALEMGRSAKHCSSRFGSDEFTDNLRRRVGEIVNSE